MQLSDQSFLYDLAADIGETHDVAAQHPKIVADLRTRLTAWEQTLVPPLWREPLGKPQTAPTAFRGPDSRTTFPRGNRIRKPQECAMNQEHRTKLIVPEQLRRRRGNGK